jgi:hypothetical protein
MAENPHRPVGSRALESEVAAIQVDRLGSLGSRFHGEASEEGPEEPA